MDSGLVASSARNDETDRVVLWPSIISNLKRQHRDIRHRFGPRAAGAGSGRAGARSSTPWPRCSWIEIGNRSDVFHHAGIESRQAPQHALIFAQSFELFFRAGRHWKHMLDSVPLPDHAARSRRGLAPGAGGPVAAVR